MTTGEPCIEFYASFVWDGRIYHDMLHQHAEAAY